MYSRIETITPDIAREYLSKNVGNRKLSLPNVRQLARDMANGDYELNDQGISFYQNGNLANGQHRLNAIIEAGIPIDIYVTYDVPNEAKMLDRGKPRSTADVFRIAGYEGAIAGTQATSAMNYLFYYCGLKKTTDSVLIDFATDNTKNLINAVSVTCSGGTNPISRKAPITAAAFVALNAGIKIESLRSFFEVVNSGFQKEPKDNPAIVLRNYLVRNYKNDYATKKQAFSVCTNAIYDYERNYPRTRSYAVGATPVYFKKFKRDVMDKYLCTYDKIR